MSLTIALQTATSGLAAAQAGLTAVSDNIANVNTPGYVRKTIVQQQLVVDGRGAGVDVTGVKRVTDQYLQLASLTAGSDAGRYNIYSQFLDNAQSLFGDPSGAGYFFNLPDDIAANFASAANDPSSTLLRTQALNTVGNFLSEADRINTQITALGSTVDSQITDDVKQVNGLLSQIDKLNNDISRAKISGGDATGSENIQSQLVNQLSGLMNVRVSARDQGGVTIRSTEGVLLVGNGATTLTYNGSDSTPGYITAVTPGASAGPQPITVGSGELRGLMDLRNSKLPGLADQLGEFVSRTAQALNAAAQRLHRRAAAHHAHRTRHRPRPADRRQRLYRPDDGGDHQFLRRRAADRGHRLQRRDHERQRRRGDGLHPGQLPDRPEHRPGRAGSASFSNGALSIAATGSNGVAIDEGTSQKAGEGFSQFFGLNDLIRSNGLSTYDTGLSATRRQRLHAGRHDHAPAVHARRQADPRRDSGDSARGQPDGG